MKDFHYELVAADELVEEGRMQEALEIYERVNALLREGDLTDPVDQAALVYAAKKVDGLSKFKHDVDHCSRFEAIFSLAGCSVYRIRVKDSDKSRKHMYSGVLQLLRAANGAASSAADFLLLKLDQFKFPLTPAVPVLRVCPGSYVLPSPDTTCFYGIMFDDRVPDAYSDALDSALSAVCSLRRMTGPRADELARAKRQHTEAAESQALVPAKAAGGDDDGGNGETKGGNEAGGGEGSQLTTVRSKSWAVRCIEAATYGVSVGSQYAAAGLTAGGNLVAGGVHRGGQALKKRVSKADSDRTVPQPVVKTLNAASKVTPHLVFVSSAVLNCLVDFACATGEVVGKYVGQSLPGAGAGGTSVADGPKMEAARGLARTTLEGFVNVWEALDDAALTLYKASGNTAVDLTRHRYGDQVADSAHDAFLVGKDLLQTKKNLGGIVGKKAAKRVAKKMTKQAVKETAREYFLFENGEKEQLLDGADDDAVEALASSSGGEEVPAYIQQQLGPGGLLSSSSGSTIATQLLLVEGSHANGNGEDAEEDKGGKQGAINDPDDRRIMELA